MAFVYFSGVETGDLSEFPFVSGSPTAATDQVTKGGYSLKVTDPSVAAYAQSKTGLSLSTAFFRANIFCNAVGSGGTLFMQPMVAYTPAFASAFGWLQLSADTSGNLTLALINGTSFATIGSVAISASQWHTVEMKVVVSATVGILEMRVDGVIIATATGLNTGTTNVDFGIFGDPFPSGTRASGSLWVDDIAISGSAYPGPGYCIARQGVAGTPNADTWTKNGAATAALCWSNTPFTTGTNCTHVGLGAAQTMLVGSFASAGSAQEGTGLIATVDTVNAGKTAMIAKSTVAGNLSIRRRVAGANTDTVVSVTTSDAYYDDGIWTPTVTNLTAGTTEIGANDTVAVVTDTVEDMWLMVDYVPLATLPLPVRRPGQKKRLPHTKAKRPATKTLTVPRIPPRPFPELPRALTTRAAQKKRTPHVKSKKPLRSNLTKQLIPPRPFPEAPRPILDRKTQAKRTPHVKAKRPLRSNLREQFKAPVPHADLPIPVRRPQAQKKRTPHLKPKRKVQSSIELRIPAAPHADQPITLRHAKAQTKRIPRVRAKRPVRNNLELRIPQALAPATPTLPLPVRHARAQTRRIPRVTHKRPTRSSIELRIPPAPAPTPTPPLSVWMRRAQVKRVPHVRRRKSLYSPIRQTPVPPPPPPINPNLPSTQSPIGGIVAISGAKAAELRGLKSGPTPDLSGSSNAPVATDKATKTS